MYETRRSFSGTFLRLNEPLNVQVQHKCLCLYRIRIRRPLLRSLLLDAGHLDVETSDTCMDIVQPFRSCRDTETSIDGSNFSGTKYRFRGCQTHIVLLPALQSTTDLSSSLPSSCIHCPRTCTPPVMNHFTPQLPQLPQSHTHWTQSNADQLDQPMALQPAGESSPNDPTTAYVIPDPASQGYMATQDHDDSMMLDPSGMLS